MKRPCSINDIADLMQSSASEVDDEDEGGMSSAICGLGTIPSR